MKTATELTPLNVESNNKLYINDNSDKFNNNNIYKYTIIKYIWYKCNGYFWRLFVLILILIVINTILHSILRETPISTINGNNNNNNIIDNEYDIFKTPNIIWIDTNYILNDEEYNNLFKMDQLFLINKFLKQSTLFENVLKDDIDKIDQFITTENNYKKYEIDDISMDESFIDNIKEKKSFIHLSLKQNSLKEFDENISKISSYLKLKQNINIWHNCLLIVHLNDFIILSGPRNPNKNRGIKSLDPFNLKISKFFV